MRLATSGPVRMGGEILATIGGVLFTQRRRSGFFFLLALLSSPRHALFGVLGLLCARWAGLVLAPESPSYRLGLYNGAGLLCGVALATYLPDGLGPWFLVPATALLAALLVNVLAARLVPLGLPILAMPFALATLLALASAEVLYQEALAYPELQPLLPGLAGLETLMGRQLPMVAQQYLRSFGSLLFLPSLTGGALILTGLLLGSRITALAMVLGGALGAGLLLAISGGTITQEAFGLVAFNSILTAAAMCGIFLAINTRSLIYSATAVAASMLLATAMVPILSRMGLPVLALPFTLTVWLFLLPVRNSTHPQRLDIWAPPLALVGRAEDNLRAFERWRRACRVPSPVLSLPLRGIWTVTQGPGGSPTHNTARGSEAWDFMLLDTAGRGAEWPGSELEQFGGFACPVLAPAEGLVVAVEGAFQDNPIHAADTRNPWGNWILIAHDSGSCSLMAHLKAGSPTVLPGQRVTRGQEVAQVGNSGRSPEPHLHVQLNATPWLDSPSLPAQFGSWVELPATGDPVFHPLGRPAAGMRIGSLFELDWPDWSMFFPYAIPGRSWRYLCLRHGRQEELTLRLRAGAWGRLILDDGSCSAQVQWWPGWIQLLPLPEGDPDRIGLPGRVGLVDLLLLLCPVLPLKGINGLHASSELRSHGLAHGWRRLLSLEADGFLEAEFRALEDPLPGLRGLGRALVDGSLRLQCEFRAEAQRGITHMKVMDGRGVALADFRLQNTLVEETP